ncbi:MAG: MucBP domain-containing protein [Bacteroidaceae bacterium]|nr:MucBP domain-containing protein [Bacteroidaceae bacterium]
MKVADSCHFWVTPKKIEEHRYVVNAGDPITLTIPTIDGYTYESGMPEAGTVASEAKTFTLRYVKNTPEGIKTVHGATRTHTSTIYNLSGQRQSTTTQGINIKDNDKLLVK